MIFFIFVENVSLCGSLHTQSVDQINLTDLQIILFKKNVVFLHLIKDFIIFCFFL
jgi:hypothetical protein